MRRIAALLRPRRKKKAPSDNQTLSAPADTPTPSKPHKLSTYDSLPTNPSSKSAIVNALQIPVPNDTPSGAVPAFLHLPSPSSTHPTPTTAAILLSGASGGIAGPSSIYLSLASKLPLLPTHPIPVLRLDYRYPARTSHCIQDVLAAMTHLKNCHHITRFVLVGWSFGSAPMFSVAAEDARIVGCVGIASQTAEAGGIRKLAPRPVLLVHGTGDRTLGASCSESLYERYGRDAGGDRRLRLFEGDDHALTRSAREVERLVGEFLVECAGGLVNEGVREGLEEEVVEDRDRMGLMREGGDLGGRENVE